MAPSSSFSGGEVDTVSGPHPKKDARDVAHEPCGDLHHGVPADSPTFGDLVQGLYCLFRQEKLVVRLFAIRLCSPLR